MYFFINLIINLFSCVCHPRPDRGSMSLFLSRGDGFAICIDSRFRGNDSSVNMNYESQKAIFGNGPFWRDRCFNGGSDP